MAVSIIPDKHPAWRLEAAEITKHSMKTRLMMLAFIGTVCFAQGQNPPAPAAAEGPGASQGGSEEAPQAKPPGPGKRGPQGGRFRAPAQRDGVSGPGEQFAGDCRGPMPGPRPEMRSEGGALEAAGGPGFGGGPEFAFEEGDDPEDMSGPAAPGGGLGFDQEIGGGPGIGGAPGSMQGRGPFGPRGERPAFGSMAQPPLEALQAVLDLNDEQVRSLHQLQRKKAGKLDEARLQLFQKQGSLLDLLEQEEPDGNALVSTVKSIHALRKQAREIEKEFEVKTAALLNEDQKIRLKSIQDAQWIPRAMQEAASFDFVRPMEMAPGGPVPEQ
jgi:hypothetical protein